MCQTSTTEQHWPGSVRILTARRPVMDLASKLNFKVWFLGHLWHQLSWVPWEHTLKQKPLHAEGSLGCAF